MRTKISCLCLIVSALCFSPTAQGYEMSDEEAETRALELTSGRQLNKSSASERSDRGYKVSKRLYSSLVALNSNSGQGFVIIGSDSESSPLVAYVPEGNFTSDEDLPPACREWLKQMNEALSVNSNANTHFLSRGEAVQPMIKSQWDQESPYNLLLDGCVTGCAATGMAQIMNYYKYPAHGYGNISYQWYENTYSLDLDNEVFDWDLIKDNYTSSDSDESAVAVSRLMRACGYSVNMMYGMSSSGADSDKIPKAMVENFGYSKAISQISRTGKTDQEWESIVLNELTCGRPLMMSGKTSTSCFEAGHLFILDGYDGNGLYHFNWGWGGYADGYYSLTIGEGMYTYRQSAFINIVPANMGPDIHPVPDLRYFDVAVGSNDEDSGDEEISENTSHHDLLNIEQTFFSSAEGIDYSGYGAIGFIDSRDQLDMVSCSPDIGDVTRYMGRDFCYQSSIPQTDGVYRIVPLFKHSDGTIVKIFGWPEYNLTVENGKVADLSCESYLSASLGFLTFPILPVENKPFEWEVQINNDGQVFQNYVVSYDLYLKGQDDCIFSYTDYNISIPVGESVVSKGNCEEGLPAGDYRMRINWPGFPNDVIETEFKIYKTEDTDESSDFNVVITGDGEAHLSSVRNTPGVNRKEVRIPKTIDVSGKKYNVVGYDRTIMRDPEIRTLIIESNIMETFGSNFGIEGTHIENLYLPEGLLELGNESLGNSYYLEYCELPSSIAKFGSKVFFSDDSLEKLVMKSVNPPLNVKDDTFDVSILQNTTLMVPSASLDAYKRARVWKEFRKIQPYESGLTDIFDDENGESRRDAIYDLTGNRHDKPVNGFNIIITNGKPRKVIVR